MTIEEAIDKAFPDAHPTYQRTIRWRFLYLYDVPLHEAIKAILAGYSSPSHAMADNVIPARKVRQDARVMYEHA